MNNNNNYLMRLAEYEQEFRDAATEDARMILSALGDNLDIIERLLAVAGSDPTNSLKIYSAYCEALNDAAGKYAERRLKQQAKE